jgi:hypothetical protein
MCDVTILRFKSKVNFPYFVRRELLVENCDARYTKLVSEFECFGSEDRQLQRLLTKMKVVALLSFGAAIGEAMAMPSLLKRQMEIPLGLMATAKSTGSKPDQAPFKTTKETPLDFPSATREKVTWGPFPLQPANVG